jgi:hypothetical protein
MTKGRLNAFERHTIKCEGEHIAFLEKLCRKHKKNLLRLSKKTSKLSLKDRAEIGAGFMYTEGKPPWFL